MIQILNKQNINTSNNCDIKSLVPDLQNLLVKFVQECLKQGINIIITQGYRSVDYQNGLYAIGRTKPGKIVTNCKGGQSPHNYKLAFDIAPLEKNGTINWSTNPLINNKWKKCAEIGKNIGLECGYYWKSFPDAPHYELPGSSAKANSLYQASLKK